MIVEEVVEQSQNKNMTKNSARESPNYSEKKKNLESVLDDLKSQTLKNKSDISYDPFTIIHKYNKLNKQNTFDENEKLVFKFLNEYCEIPKEIDELKEIDNLIYENIINHDDARNNNLNKMTISDDFSPNQKNTNNSHDAKMKNVVSYDPEEVENLNMDVEAEFTSNFDLTKFKKVKKIDNSLRRKIIAE